MAQDRLGHARDVLAGDREAAVEQRARLRADDERLARARTGAPRHPLAHALGRKLVLGPRGARELARRNRRRRRGPGRAARDPGARGPPSPRARSQAAAFSAGGLQDDAPLLLQRRIVHESLQKEAVELGLGEGVGALLLDRVLGRHDEEGARQVVGALVRSQRALFEGLGRIVQNVQFRFRSGTGLIETAPAGAAGH